MELLCPDCRSPLQVAVPGVADCVQHGGHFDVLFDRYAAPAGTGAAPGEEQAAGWRRVERPAAMCAEHPGNPSVADCRVCAKPVCATCDFALPGGVHLCPGCVERSHSSDEVSPKRKRLSYIALVLATWSTILVVLMFSGAFNSILTDDKAGEAADVLITSLALWPLLIGTALSMSALDKRLKNTAVMKVAMWWNGILGGLLLLFVLLANLGVFG